MSLEIILILAKEREMELIDDKEVFAVTPKQLANAILFYAPIPLFPKNPDIYGKILEELKEHPDYGHLLKRIQIDEINNKKIPFELRDRIGANKWYCVPEFAPNAKFKNETDYYALVQPILNKEEREIYENEELRIQEDPVLAHISDTVYDKYKDRIAEQTKTALKHCIVSFYTKLLKEPDFQRVFQKHQLEFNNPSQKE